MRRALLLLLAFAGGAAAEDFALLAIRDNPKQDPDAAPPRTAVSIDVIGRSRILATRRIKFHDAAVRSRLFSDPFVAPSGGDYGALVVTDGNGIRCLRFSWTTGEQLGHSFTVSCGAPRTWIARPVHIVPERLGVLTKDALLSFDLRLGNLFRTHVDARPLQLDPARNRLYVAGRPLGFFPVIAAEPPTGFDTPPKPLFALPDGMHAERAVFSSDGTRVVYVSRPESRRKDADRFVLSVADALGRLHIRRSLTGRFHDLRWMDDEQVMFTTTNRELTSIHTLVLKEDRLTTRRLPERYLAPPEIVPVALLGGAMN